MTDCRAVIPLLGAYFDGQLDAVNMLQVEEHVGSCEACRERVELDRATRASLKRAMKEESAPADARARVLAAMTAAAAEAPRASDPPPPVSEQPRASIHSLPPAAPPGTSQSEVERLFGWRTMLPLTAAAALALMWGSVARAPAQGQMQSVRMGIDDPLADLVAEHAHPLPAEYRNENDIQACEQYVGVRVHPGRLQRAGARLVGARVLPVHQERAAVLHYEIPQGGEIRRVSLFVYDPRRIQVGSSFPDLSPRAVGSAEMLVGRSGGYSVAVTQRAGVGYALATDLDPEGSAQLAALVDDGD